MNLKDECPTFRRQDASAEPIKHQFSYGLDMEGPHLTRFCTVNNERRQKNSLSVTPFVISPALKTSCVQRRRWKRLSFITAEPADGTYLL